MERFPPNGLMPGSSPASHVKLRTSVESRLPEPRGKQCGLLRLATGGQFVAPVAKRACKATYVLVEHMNQMGDFANHAKGEHSLTMAVAYCLAAVELIPGARTTHLSVRLKSVDDQGHFFNSRRIIGEVTLSEHSGDPAFRIMQWGWSPRTFSAFENLLEADDGRPPGALRGIRRTRTGQP